MRTTECRPHFESFSAMLDDELTPEEQQRLQGHLNDCASCRKEYESLREAEGLMERVLPTITLEAGLWKGIESEISDGFRRSSAADRPTPGRSWWRWAVPATAAVLMVAWFTLPWSPPPQSTTISPSVDLNQSFNDFFRSREELEKRRHQPGSAESRRWTDSENPYRAVSFDVAGNPYAAAPQ